MGCNSGKVQTAADKASKAQDAIDTLNKKMEAESTADKAKFQSEIDSSLSAANIKDGRLLDSNFAIKTEYTSEFSLDKIANVVTSALKALKAVVDAKGQGVQNPAASPAAIDSYVAVVNSVAESAKSSSTASASLSFSMNRLSPGLFAFLYAKSTSLTDEGLFGKEAVTTTAIYYQFVQSIDDLKNQGSFDAARIDQENYIKMKTILSGYVDDLSNGKITIAEYSEKDQQMTVLINQAKQRLDDAGFPTTNMLAMVKGAGTQAEANKTVVRTAISKLSTMGGEYTSVVQSLEKRLETGEYF